LQTGFLSVCLSQFPNAATKPEEERERERERERAGRRFSLREEVPSREKWEQESANGRMKKRKKTRELGTRKRSGEPASEQSVPPSPAGRSPTHVGRLATLIINVAQECIRSPSYGRQLQKVRH
jgi:hypothetical protein